MSDDSTMHVRASVEIAAPPEEVFEALIDPEALPQWFLAPAAATTYDWELDLAPAASGGRAHSPPTGVKG